MLGSAAWWFLAPHPASSHNKIEWTILAAALAFAIINEIVLRYDLPIARAFPYGTVLADWAIIGSSLWGSGGRSSPFQDFILVGLVTTSLRVEFKAAVFAILGYAALALLFGDNDSLIPDGVLMVVLGTLVALWADALRRQHLSAVRDPLTGTFSRDFGMQRLNECVARGPFPFVVATVDFDGFKSINDTYGHAVGDIVLRNVTHIMSSVLRSDDFLCRTGGDEFMVVFQDVDATTSMSLGERLRAIVESSPIRLRDENASVKVTLSIGLAEALPGISAAQLLKTADDAMYVAKRKTNNVVVRRCLDVGAASTAARAANAWI